MGWQIFEFGRLSLDGEPVELPYGEASQITPSYCGEPSFFLTSSCGGRGITWVKPDNLPIFVSSRVLLNNISWETLNFFGFVRGKKVVIDGHTYYCRLPRVGTAEGEYSEWDKIISMTSEENFLLNWKSMHSIGEETSVRNQSVCRGYSSANHFAFFEKNSRCATLGFRPILELANDESQTVNKKITLDGQEFFISQLLETDEDVFYPRLNPVTGNPFRGISDGSIVKMYTLLCDGIPVSQEFAERGISHRNNGMLTLTDKFYGENFLVPWTISHGCAIAATAIFRGINAAELKRQGFL